MNLLNNAIVVITTDSSQSHQGGGGGLNAFYWYQIFAVGPAVVEAQKC